MQRILVEGDDMWEYVSEPKAQVGLWTTLAKHQNNVDDMTVIKFSHRTLQ